MRYILQPIKIPEKINLCEALVWAVFKVYSVEEDFYDSGPQNERTFWPYERLPFVIGKAPKLPNLASMPESPGMLPESNNPSELQEYQNKFRDFKEKQYISRKQETEVWNKLTENIRAELFLALSTGKIEAEGKLYGKIKSDVDQAFWTSHEAWDSINSRIIEIGDDFDIYKTEEADKLKKESDKLGKQKIPKTFWRLEGIDWFESKAKSESVWYHSIEILTEELLKIFPEPEPEITKIEVRSGVMIYDDKKENLEISEGKKKGRPSKIDVNFHSEITKYLLNNKGLPKRGKQKDLEIHMSEWCTKNGLRVGESTIRTYVGNFLRRLSDN